MEDPRAGSWHTTYILSLYNRLSHKNKLLSVSLLNIFSNVEFGHSETRTKSNVSRLRFVNVPGFYTAVIYLALQEQSHQHEPIPNQYKTEGLKDYFAPFFLKVQSIMLLSFRNLSSQKWNQTWNVIPPDSAAAKKRGGGSLNTHIFQETFIFRAWKGWNALLAQTDS